MALFGKPISETDIAIMPVPHLIHEAHKNLAHALKTQGTPQSVNFSSAATAYAAIATATLAAKEFEYAR